eukprot:TRINITY_DN1662_c0_g4_i1.p1 TRINITY_DN1662_c0_g4~~TRINITY_DN1662_c0_g4_i1.p1  ORF type:complete len:177 (+),score=47.00 TRINITY_DN1662_c0_g4_i1:67-597(+)
MNILEEQLDAERDIDFAPLVQLKREAYGDSATPDSAFELAMVLIKEGSPSALEEGVSLLEMLSVGLLETAPQETARQLGYTGRTGGGRSGDTEEERLLLHYYYFIALAKYKQKELSSSIACCKKILKLKPNNHQVQSLLSLASRKNEEELIKTGILAGIATTALGIGILVLKGRKK